MKRQLAVWSIFGLAFVINPNLACSSGDDPEYDYGESEMKAAVLGDWQGSAELDGKTIAFTLKLEQAADGARTQGVSGPPIRPQCSSRSFVKPAGACADITTMPLVGTIESEDAAFTGDVTGSVMAGLKLDYASLDLTLPDDSTMNGQLHDQAVEAGSIFGQGPLGTFTLSRP